MHCFLGGDCWILPPTSVKLHHLPLRRAPRLPHLGPQISRKLHRAQRTKNMTTVTTVTTESGRGTGASCPLLLGPTTFAAATTSWVSRKWPKQPPKQTQIGFGIVDLLWPAFLHGVDELVWIWIWQSKGWHQEATAPSISFSFLKGKALASEPLSTLQDVIWFY